MTQRVVTDKVTSFEVNYYQHGARLWAVRSNGILHLTKSVSINVPVRTKIHRNRAVIYGKGTITIATEKKVIIK